MTAVHEARIHTFTVEVQTLMISDRQVTLSVFRQLPRRHVIDQDVPHLVGDVWGWVNYHPDKCAGGNPHHHIVWSAEDRLFRATEVDPLWHPDVRYPACSSAEWKVLYQEAWEALSRTPQLFIAL